MSSARLSELVSEFGMVERALGDPAVLAQPQEYTRLTRRHRELTPLVTLYRERETLQAELAGARSLLQAEADPELRELAGAEVQALTARLEELEAELEVLLLPTDPDDIRDVILELRAGAGGAEAGLFAMDLLRMYTRYAEGQGLTLNVLDAAESDLGGKQGRGRSDRRLCLPRPEVGAGVHRVQRVPATESQGRIHTSTVTVAVLPQVEQSEVHLDLLEVRIDVFRSQGAGGQGVNTTDSAVRAVYRAGTPDEIMVVCQDGRSQIKNREKALQILAARLAERERVAREASERSARASQIGTGDRSEKVRTYNYPQNRVTDHRLEGESKNYALESVIAGDLAGLVGALARAERERQLLDMGQEDAHAPA
ncbi:PCRF domain-containing protein [Deinococcus lacus]|uniref:PCRF domain-containing protein n=1 Tax=Deinococcus lacus TaxID=392561 RepID=A0ABW1YAD4_9DEIO